MITEKITTECFKAALTESISYLKKRKSSIKDFSVADINNAYLKARNVEIVKTT
ncbi:MAG: hypothetical protein QMB40_09655 [Aeromonadaceae bacterium]